MGRGSPRRGSRNLNKRQKGMILIVHIKTHNPNSRCGNLSNTYTKPPKFSVLMIFSTVSCLESDNDVSTSNTTDVKNLLFLARLEFFMEDWVCYTIFSVQRFHILIFSPKLKAQVINYQIINTCRVLKLCTHNTAQYTLHAYTLHTAHYTTRFFFKQYI